MGWNTDAFELAKAIVRFERQLPGFWWSVGQCSVGAHASCAIDAKGEQDFLLKDIEVGDPFDSGFHVDTLGGAPHEALREVMHLALEDPCLKEPKP